MAVVPAIFRRAVLEWTPKLKADFGFGDDDAFAILGNAGHESNGLQTMQEVKPTSGTGGLGAFQWTGPRRRTFVEWLRRKKAATNGLDASYGMLFRELKGPESKAVAATKRAVGLDAKVEAFEKAFERAGVKHYPSRKKWARVARDVWAEERAKKPAVAVAEPRTTPTHWWQRLLGVKAPQASGLVGTNKGDNTLFLAQNQLLAAGYTAVGDPDGMWGPDTKTAVRQALREQAPSVALPEDWPLSDEVLAALAKLQVRKVAASRADIKAADLRANGATVAKAPTAMIGGGGIAGFLGFGKLIESTGVLDGVTKVTDQTGEVLGTIQAALGTMGTAFTFVTTYWWAFAIAGGVYFLAKGIRWMAETVLLVRGGFIRQTTL